MIRSHSKRIVLWFVLPCLRRFGPVLAAITLLAAIGLIFLNIHKETVQGPRIPISQVQLMNLHLVHRNSSYELAGTVKNNSDHWLCNVYLRIHMYDCSDSFITSSCTVIGQDDRIDISVDIPPKQARAIDNAFVSLPHPPKGKLLWSYDVMGVEGRE
jgi:hypothetical protein